MNTSAHTAALPRSRSLTANVVQALGDQIRAERLLHGSKLPREADLMAEFGVSRTVVREAMSHLQAAGMVETRHGIGTFVVGLGDSGTFRIAPDQVSTLQDVIAVLELRIAVETEGAGLAALRRTDTNLTALRGVLAAFVDAVEEGRDAVGPDFQFHLELARATQNPRFAELMITLGGTMIPRARLDDDGITPVRATYLRGVHLEHQSIFDAVERRDADAARAAMRTHLSNSRERRRRALTAVVR